MFDCRVAPRLPDVEIKGCEDMHKAFKQYLATTQKGKLPPEIAQFLRRIRSRSRW